ncbi:MAG: endolytic transglycosylase MltG [Bacteroidales bacterium]|nr:endolytic transglycosylase MltG [Bacteroidales bacterium]MDD2425624.1 endolytic transglycosylase MltG [Bacteroidales bacterium]MDD3989748.1 endolytic transglycosylase MltG [Bacteroidales bacterium]MDD4638809.1 endolytic transglycosylase MltG [Bacteroidales bacterium]
MKGVAKKRFTRVVITISLLIIFLAFGFLLKYYILYYSPNTTYTESCIYISKGSTWKDVMDTLRNSSAIKRVARFEKVAKRERLPETFKPGRYRIKPESGNLSLVRTLKFGWQEPMKLTISGNIRSMERLSSLLSKKLDCDSLSFIEEFSRRELMDSLKLTKETFISLFLPNTYEVYWTITPNQLVNRMKREYDRFWDGERKKRAKELGFSPVEVITLASIVSQESNVADELPVIAGVYLNRLKRGIPLQADPTIKFATGDDSLRRILRKHLEIDSPYNTYIYSGLPPGPIVIPPVNAIDAVLKYREHNYLYFCAKPALDGTHNFAATLSEHNRNASAYHRAINSLPKR